MCDHICVLSEQPFLCSLPLGGTGTPPVNFCIGCKLTTIHYLMLWFSLSFSQCFRACNFILKISTWKLFLRFLFILCVRVFCWHVCWCTMHMKCQNRATDPLKLALQVVVSCSVDARNRSQVLWMSSQCSYPPSLFSSPQGVVQSSCLFGYGFQAACLHCSPSFR